MAPPAQRSASHSATTPPQRGGREELRAALLKPYLLRLRDTEDDAAVRALLGRTGIAPSVVDDETGWISVAAACRALRALDETLGPGALCRRGTWQTHRENLGTYVRLLRSAAEPIDAYRYLADHPDESSRVGSYELTETSLDSVRMVYRPRPDEDIDQDDPLLCQVREGELASMPLLWGLPNATVSHGECLARGDDCCSYEVSWSSPGAGLPSPIAAIGGGFGMASLAGFVGGWIPATAAGLVGVAAGWGAAKLVERNRKQQAGRALDRHRIWALERGLELRGEAMATAAPGDLRGTVLGAKYRIMNKIGSGGIGVVYGAEHIALGSHVAVKVLRGAAAKDAGEIARLRREAQIQVSIEHPNVIRTLDLDQMPDGSIYVVMELLRGQSLAEYLSRSGALPPAMAVPLFIQVCRALQAAHDKGVVHRDLKPGNVFLCEDGSAKVLDFGMSKFAAAESLTQTGYTLGTPEYMAPEQCIGAPVEPRTDIYAFGVLMYEALTGHLPIVGGTRRELLELHQRHVPTSMRSRKPDLEIPEHLDQIVMATLSKRLEDRPRSAAVLERMLSAIPPGTLPSLHPPSGSRTRAQIAEPLTRRVR